MIELIQLAKSKLRLDEGDDELAALHVESAKESLKRSGVNDQEGALYKTAVLIQVVLDYENQDKDLNVDALNNALQSIILKLKSYGGDDE